MSSVVMAGVRDDINVAMTVTGTMSDRSEPAVPAAWVLSCEPKTVWPEDVRDVAGHLVRVEDPTGARPHVWSFVPDHQLGSWRNAHETMTYRPSPDISQDLSLIDMLSTFPGEDDAIWATVDVRPPKRHKIETETETET